MYRTVYGHLPSINPYRRGADLNSTTTTGAQSSHAGGIVSAVDDFGANVANDQIITPSATGDQENQVCETLYVIMDGFAADVSDGRIRSPT